MKQHLLAFLLMCVTLCGYSQAAADEEILIDPDEPASFKGGEDSLKEYLARTLKYPTCQEATGTVWIELTVEKDGQVSDAKVVKGISPAYDEEALRVVKAMPPWLPGKSVGEPKRSQMVIPIKFKIER